MVDPDLSLAELLHVCRACAWLRLERDPGNWFQPFLLGRLRPHRPALADRVSRMSGPKLRTLARLVQLHQRFGRWVPQRSL